MKKLLVVLMILGLAAAPAMAAEVTFSGSQVVQFTWTSIDGAVNDDFGGYSSNKGPQNNGVLSYPKNGKSTGIRLNWTASDTLSGVVNISQGALYTAGPDASEENAFFKDTYAAWNFGAGTMRFGYFGGASANFVAFATGMDDDPWIFKGSFLNDRSAGMGFDFGGFTLELKENYGKGAGAYTDVDTLIPQIVAAYGYRSKMFSIRTTGFFQTWSIEDQANEESLTVNGMGISLTGRVNLGPAYIGMGAWYVQNASTSTHSLIWGKDYRLDATGTEIENYTAMNISLAGGVRISPKLAINLGVCYNSGYYDEEDTDYETNAFLNVNTNIGPIMFTPEIGYRDQGENNGVDADKTIYVTAQFKVFW